MLLISLLVGNNVVAPAERQEVATYPCRVHVRVPYCSFLRRLIEGSGEKRPTLEAIVPFEILALAVLGEFHI